MMKVSWALHGTGEDWLLDKIYSIVKKADDREWLARSAANPRRDCHIPLAIKSGHLIHLLGASGHYTGEIRKD